MTSLIFGAIYMGHQGVVAHRREKQRTKNYERWEGLRDEYDAQRKISRESRSLDLQRTGSVSGGQSTLEQDYDRPILTLRDQQEADDARTSWRPQESFEAPSYTGQRHASVPSVPPQQTGSAQPYSSTSTISTAPQTPTPRSSAGLPALVPQGTGVTWDEGLPQPLQVSRRSFDDYNYGRYGGRVDRTVSTSTTTSSQQQSRSGSLSRSVSNREPGMIPASRHRPSSTLKESATLPTVPHAMPEYVPQSYYANPVSMVKPHFNVEPIESHVPGGRMAELIERGF